MVSQDYDSGGYFNFDYSPEAGDCAEKCICGALDVGLTAITAALLEINYTLQRKIDNKCEIVDKCKQEIIDLIDEHYRGHTKSCDECKADLAAGLGGTLEYAVACAGACIDEAKKESPCDSLSQEGESCDTCGCKPCKCTGLECVSVDPSACEEEEKKYLGWCNPLTGSVVVREVKLGSPGPEWTQGIAASTEESAFEQTKQFCDRTGIHLPQPGHISPVFTDSFNCQIDAYISGRAIDGILANNPGLNLAAANVQGFSGLLQFGFEGLNLGRVSDVVYGTARVLSGAPAFWASQMTPLVAAACGVADPRWSQCLDLLTNIGVVSKFTGMDFSPYTDSIRYAANALSRQQYLSPGQAMDAYLSDAITGPQLDAHWAIANLCNDSMNQAAFAAKSKANASQLIAMRDRRLIDDNVLYAGFRQLGYLDTDVVSHIVALSDHVPDLGSVIRMGQKGVTNANNVSHFQLESGFSTFKSGQLEQWLAADAVKQETARLLWCAHWSDPSVSDLFNFLSRLRDDNSVGGESQLRQDIDATLDKLGIAPYWRKHYLATAFNPLPIRAIKGAYTSGALSEDELKPALRLTGADDASIEVYLKEYKPARRVDILGHKALQRWIEQVSSAAVAKAELTADGYDEQTATQALKDKEWEFERSTWASCYTKGLMTKAQFSAYLSGWGVSGEGIELIATKLSFQIVDHAAQKNYIAGTLSRDEANQRMQTDGMPAETIYRLLRDADDGIANALALDCVRGIKHRYMNGEISNDEATHFLANRGIAADRIGQLVGNFACERNATGRQVAVEKLCHWLYIGAISQPDFMDRLLRLGYSEENAALLLYDCVQANTLRAIKEADRIVKQTQSDIDKVQRARDKANASVKRNADRLANARKKKAQLRENRDKQLLSAAEKLYSATEGPLTEAIQIVKDGTFVCSDQYGLDVDECLKIAILAAGQMKGAERSDFITVVRQLAEAAASSGLEPTDEDIGLSPSSNGDTQPSG